MSYSTRQPCAGGSQAQNREPPTHETHQHRPLPHLHLGLPASASRLFGSTLWSTSARVQPSSAHPPAASCSASSAAFRTVNSSAPRQPHATISASFAIAFADSIGASPAADALTIHRLIVVRGVRAAHIANSNRPSPSLTPAQSCTQLYRINLHVESHQEEARTLRPERV